MQVLFKQFFATAVMGLGHGLILLPVLLSVFGPASYRYACCLHTVFIHPQLNLLPCAKNLFSVLLVV